MCVCAVFGATAPNSLMTIPQVKIIKNRWIHQDQSIRNYYENKTTTYEFFNSK